MSQIGAFSQHLLTMNSEDPNQEDTAAVDGVLREYARTGGPGDDERFVASVSHRITKAKNAVERDWPWLFGRVFWKAQPIDLSPDGKVSQKRAFVERSIALNSSCTMS